MMAVVLLASFESISAERFAAKSKFNYDAQGSTDEDEIPLHPTPRR